MKADRPGSQINLATFKRLAIGQHPSIAMADPSGMDSKHVQSDAVPAAFAGPNTQLVPPSLDESDFVTVREDQDLRRGLHQRHIGLIAIAGAIVRTEYFTLARSCSAHSAHRVRDSS